MTVTAKIAKEFDVEKPRLAEIFTEGFRQKIKNIDSKLINMVRESVENYISNNLSDCLVSHKLYAYKFFDAIVIEIFLKPVETANVLGYRLYLSPSESRLERIK